MMREKNIYCSAPKSTSDQTRFGTSPLNTLTIRDVYANTGEISLHPGNICKSSHLLKPKFSIDS